MKTAISIPDNVFRAAERLARRLGLSRSELYARAVAEFVAQHRGQDITERLNAVYDEREISHGPPQCCAARAAARIHIWAILGLSPDRGHRWVFPKTGTTRRVRRRASLAGTATR